MSGHRKSALGVLILGALGVVFGDIGTSVLYALHTVFSASDHAIPLNEESVFGVISMVFWTVTLVVSIKYVTFIMRADNDGEGGIMALIALVKRLSQTSAKAKVALTALGIFGASLFIGDAMITPAISVLSAVEGLEVINPSLHSFILPIAVVIILCLFAVQRYGTAVVGRFFGPVCCVWFAVLAIGGVGQIISHPDIIKALSPTFGLSFAFNHPGLAFIALSGVVLTVTGVEALYADMGHFSTKAIRIGWFFVVFPALTLNYMGQGALLLHTEGAIENPFFLLYPDWAQLLVVILATAATVIASQAVLSGAFSVARQAMQLGFVPRLTIKHTSTEIGQVYVPAVNWGILVAVLLLVFLFRSSENLAAAYGIAVTGTLIIDTVLFATVLHFGFGRRLRTALAAGILFGIFDLLLFSANISKIFHGGWFPLLIAACAFTVLMTWDKGRELVTSKRKAQEGPLRDFVESVHQMQPPIHRVNGTAIFLNADPKSAPLALRANVEHNHTLHKAVLIASVSLHNVPNIDQDERVSIDDLGYTDDGIFHVTIHYGFQDDIDVPSALQLAHQRGLETAIDLDNATYFLSRVTLKRADNTDMAGWRKRLFFNLAAHAANPVEYFSLPTERTIIMGGHITV